MFSRTFLRLGAHIATKSVHKTLMSNSGLLGVGARRMLSTESEEPEMSNFLGASSAYTSKLELKNSFPKFECFRRMNLHGDTIDPDYKPTLDDATLLKLYTYMVRINVMDNIYYDAQRQGRISFYMTCYGEEAIQVGTTAALDPEDTVFAQYREMGVLMWRGFGYEDFAHQLFSNAHDLGKGRQMPIHYGSKKYNYHTISSPLGTQLPQAVGAAYAYKREGNGKVAVCYFGDGAASEGDFHSAMNMASTLDCPVIFICRNNGYAISTPTREQYRGDGIAVRGPAYGIHTIRVDGGDTLALYDATAHAREFAVANNRPVLIEAMAYRGGHHSTSDDSSRYRSMEELTYWHEKESALERMRLYVEKRGLWDSEKELKLRQDNRKEVLQAIAKAENVKKPALSQLFEDVYHEMPTHLQEQQQELMDHIAGLPSDVYDIEKSYEAEDTYVNPGKV